MIEERLLPFKNLGCIPGLERMEKLLSMLGNPEKNLKCIHVAGTNGKGSVCEYIYRGLQSNGYKVGLFTSPQISIFNDRIEYNENYISDKELEELGNAVLEAAITMKNEGDSPTEFEIITTIAFLYFAKKNPDFVILEVGMGGKGDSTNIISNPLVSIITSISSDHKDFLGSTIREIAFEKGGIIKKGIPVVSGVENEEAKKEIAKISYQRGARMYDTTKNKYTILKNDIDGSQFSTVIDYTNYSDVELSMLGEHQVKNAMVALTAIEMLRQKGIVKVERTKLYEGIKNASKKCRFEIIKDYKGKSIVLDGAHNEDAAKQLSKTINEIFPNKKILSIISIMKDKECEKIIKEISTFTEKFVLTKTDSERCMDTKILSNYVKKTNIEFIEHDEYISAIKNISSEINEYDVILFSGSLDFVGKVRNELCKTMKEV